MSLSEHRLTRGGELWLCDGCEWSAPASLDLLDAGGDHDDDPAMTAHVSPDAPRPPTRNQPRGVTMPFDEADFTRDAARMVAEGDRVPAQRDTEGMDEGREHQPWVGSLTLAAEEAALADRFSKGMRVTINNLAGQGEHTFVVDDVRPDGPHSFILDLRHADDVAS